MFLRSPHPKLEFILFVQYIWNLCRLMTLYENKNNFCGVIRIFCYLSAIFPSCKENKDVDMCIPDCLEGLQSCQRLPPYPGNTVSFIFSNVVLRKLPHPGRFTANISLFKSLLLYQETFRHSCLVDFFQNWPKSFLKCQFLNSQQGHICFSSGGSCHSVQIRCAFVFLWLCKPLF